MYLSFSGLFSLNGSSANNSSFPISRPSSELGSPGEGVSGLRLLDATAGACPDWFDDELDMELEGVLATYAHYGIHV